jgi:hypothetical protein
VQRDILGAMLELGIKFDASTHPDPGVSVGGVRVRGAGVACSAVTRPPGERERSWQSVCLRGHAALRHAGKELRAGSWGRLEQGRETVLPGRAEAPAGPQECAGDDKRPESRDDHHGEHEHAGIEPEDEHADDSGAGSGCPAVGRDRVRDRARRALGGAGGGRSDDGWHAQPGGTPAPAPRAGEGGKAPAQAPPQKIEILMAASRGRLARAQAQASAPEGGLGGCGGLRCRGLARRCYRSAATRVAPRRAVRTRAGDGDSTAPSPPCGPRRGRCPPGGERCGSPRRRGSPPTRGPRPVQGRVLLPPSSSPSEESAGADSAGGSDSSAASERKGIHSMSAAIGSLISPRARSTTHIHVCTIRCYYGTARLTGEIAACRGAL